MTRILRTRFEMCEWFIDSGSWQLWLQWQSLSQVKWLNWLRHKPDCTMLNYNCLAPAALEEFFFLLMPHGYRQSLQAVLHYSPKYFGSVQTIQPEWQTEDYATEVHHCWSRWLCICMLWLLDQVTTLGWCRECCRVQVDTNVVQYLSTYCMVNL